MKPNNCWFYIKVYLIGNPYIFAPTYRKTNLVQAPLMYNSLFDFEAIIILR